MGAGSIVGDVDVAQLLVFAFVIFFLGLVLHLRREDKREGYPLKDPAGGGGGEGFPTMPRSKTFHLRQGGEVLAPHPEEERKLAAEPLFGFPGSPLTPTGDPLRDGVGPASYALRRTEPTWYAPGVTQMAPLRTASDWTVVRRDPDPRGMTVRGSDGEAAGVVRDLWIDRGVTILRYLEVELQDGARALLPIHHTEIRRRHFEVRVNAIRAAQFAQVPRLADPDVVTAREEDQINAFYAGARFFNGEARRLESRRRRGLEGRTA